MAVLRYRHRDRGRPLSEQRRPIGGIVGGGDTPVQETLYIKAKNNQSTFAFGFLTPDKIFHWQMFSESVAKLANAEGVIQSNTIQQAQGYWNNVLKAKLQTMWDVQTYEVEVDATLNPGATIQNWQNYKIVE